MGRDRAKEKIQAHRKVRLEKKEAKAEERETEREEQKIKKAAQSGHKKKNPKKDNELEIEDLNASAETKDEEPGTSAHCSRNQPSTSKDTQQFDDTSDLGASSVPSLDADCSKDGKGKKTPTSTKVFASGNPNHRDSIKPLWKNIHEENVARKAERKMHKAAKSRKPPVAPRSLKVGDIALTPTERGQLRKILDCSRLEQDHVAPAVVACALGRFDLVKKFMSDGLFDAKYIEGQRITPLGCAIQTDTINWDIIDFIINNNLHPFCKDSFGNTPLIKAALCSHWNPTFMLDLWLKLKPTSRPTDIAASNKAGVTWVHALAYRGWVKVLQDVLNIDFEDAEDISAASLVNADMADGCTPLMLAIDQGEYATCTLLLSQGAKPLVEDKAGFTPMCRAVAFLYNNMPKFVGSGIPPLCNVIMGLLLHKDLANWDLKSYANRRLQAIKIPAVNCFNFVELFNRLGRAVFVFVLRCMKGGKEILLQLRVFEKLSAIGQRNIMQNDILYTVLGIIFELLVYAEDASDFWPRYARTFLREGASELCLRILQMDEALDDSFSSSSGKTKDQLSSTRSVSEVSSLPDFRDIHESLSHLEQPPPAKKNMHLAAMLPFVQLIDSQLMDSWFVSNFEVLSTSYRKLVSESPSLILTCKLSLKHSDRTNRKAILFNNLMMQDRWISPHNKEFWKKTIFQYQKVSKTKKQLKPIIEHPQKTEVVETDCVVKEERPEIISSIPFEKSMPSTSEPVSVSTPEDPTSDLTKGEDPLISLSSSNVRPSLFLRRPKKKGKVQINKTQKKIKEVKSNAVKPQDDKVLVGGNKNWTAIDLPIAKLYEGSRETMSKAELLSLINLRKDSGSLLSQSRDSGTMSKQQCDKLVDDCTRQVNTLVCDLEENETVTEPTETENSETLLGPGEDTESFGIWYHDAMRIIVGDTGDIFSFQGISMFEDEFIWNQMKLEIRSKYIDEHVLGGVPNRIIMEVTRCCRDLCKPCYFPVLDDGPYFLANVELELWSKFIASVAPEETTGETRWLWLHCRREKAEKELGLGFFMNPGYVLKYLYTEFETFEPYEVMEDMERCFDNWMCGIFSTAGPVCRYFMNFQKINNVVSIQLLEDIDFCSLDSTSMVIMNMICPDDVAAEISRSLGTYLVRKHNTRTSVIYTAVDCSVQTSESVKKDELTKKKLIKRKTSVYKKALECRVRFPRRIKPIPRSIFLEGFKMSYPIQIHCGCADLPPFIRVPAKVVNEISMARANTSKNPELPDVETAEAGYNTNIEKKWRGKSRRVKTQTNLKTNLTHPSRKC